MMLRKPRAMFKNQPPENAFFAVDERSGNNIGSCVIVPNMLSELFPERPYRLRLELEGDESVQDVLMGAAMARARAMAAELGEPARIYASCDPNDADMLELFKQYGFKDNDGIVSMSATLPVDNSYRAPAGCVIIKDDLSDQAEAKLFLERWNRFFAENRDQGWLNEYANKPYFQRIITVVPTGMVGEVVTWIENGEGHIGFLHTTKRWRGLGVAGYMLSQACEDLYADGANLVRADLHVRIPYLLHTLERFGFVQQKLIKRYPGIDL